MEEQQLSQSNQASQETSQLSESSKKERRELKHQEQIERQISFYKKNKRKRFFRIIIAFIFIAAALFFSFKWFKKSNDIQPGEAISIQPADHINPGDPIPGIYLSNPPVSGWHYADTAEWGIYDKELSDQLLIHNLEHGGIWISYKPSVAPPEIIDNLKAVASKFKTKIILTPREANNDMIALAAWGRLDKFNYFDEARILKFIKTYKDKGPEFVP